MRAGSRWKRFRRRLRYWLDRSERQRLLWEEMEFHIDSMVQELAAQGMSEPEAGAAASVPMGWAEPSRKAAFFSTEGQMHHPWYDDGYFVGCSIMVPWSLGLAALFFFRPNWADRLYRGFGFRITEKRGRLLGYLCLAGAVGSAAEWLAYVI